MRIMTRFLLLLSFTINYYLVNAQIISISPLGQFSDGNSVNVPCNGGTLHMTAYHYVNGVLYDLIVDTQYISAIPNGYTASNYAGYGNGPGGPGGNVDIAIVSNNNQNGPFKIQIKSFSGDPFFDKVITLDLSSAPESIYFNPNPPVTLGSNQSGSVSVTIKIDHSSYNNVNWSTDYGLKVNGNSSYTDGYTGSSNSQTISTNPYGGYVYVNASNACGSTKTISYQIGPPFIAYTTFNGSQGSSGTVPYVATLALVTNGSATNANWSVTNGSGSISQYGTSCNAYPSNFLRVVSYPTNSSGSGPEATFYVWKNGNSGYRMAYPNPTNDQINLDFDDPIIPEELLTDLSIVDESGKIWRQFDTKKAKSNNYFKENKGVSFDVKNIPKGTYYIRIKLGEKLNSERIVIE